MRLLVVVPCRDEAAVVARRLRNLARCRWPASARPHRVVVVDDGSRDGTAEIARAEAARWFGAARGVEARVVESAGPPGKPGAVRAGLAHAADGFELVVLTDADVVTEDGALTALARAFEADPRLALACGAQRCVRDLASDGSARGADGGAPADAAAPWDRWTARARRLESRAGLVFSVHGQLLAWRADLGLAPTPGIAADDLDLMLQVRARTANPRRVELVPDAAFLEVKTPAGPDADAQALRRARAWFQVLWRSAPPARGLAARVQWAAYRHLPGPAPAASAAAALALPCAALAWGGWAWAAACGAFAGLLAASPAGRRWIALMRTIASAARRERREPLRDAWEMART
jgi:hypothetical protein